VIKRPPGPFMIHIENRSGKDLDGFRMDPEGSSNPAVHLLQKAIRKEEVRSLFKIVLPPGSYTLKQSDEPGWSCKLVIAPSATALEP
jgi:hypothetical protein